MPLKRTPPISPSKLNSGENSRAYGSDSNIAVTKDMEVDAIVPRNIKRRRGESGDSKKQFADIFDKWSMDQECKFTTIMKSMNDIKVQNNDNYENIQRSIEFLSKKYDEALEKIRYLEGKNRDDLRYIKTLEAKLENCELNRRATCFEMKNIPVLQSENKENLASLVVETGKILNTTILQSDICDVFRINTKSETGKPIIVKLNSVLLRDKLLRNVKKYNKENKENKLNTSTLLLNGAKKPIYITENLSSQSNRLFYIARGYAKEKGFKFCWTSHGKIYLRKAEGAPAIRVEKECDLDSISK